MVIYRPNRGMLSEAMKQAREFDSRESMLEYVCQEHNKEFSWFQITPEEIYLENYGTDERVGWHNCYMLLFERPSKIKNIKGYQSYFRFSDEKMASMADEPCGILGMFSTDYTSTKSMEASEGMKG